MVGIAKIASEKIRMALVAAGTTHRAIRNITQLSTMADPQNSVKQYTP
jgi:hypothetical protein